MSTLTTSGGELCVTDCLYLLTFAVVTFNSTSDYRVVGLLAAVRQSSKLFYIPSPNPASNPISVSNPKTVVTCKVKHLQKCLVFYLRVTTFASVLC